MPRSLEEIQKEREQLARQLAELDKEAAWIASLPPPAPKRPVEQAVNDLRSKLERHIGTIEGVKDEEKRRHIHWWPSRLREAVEKLDKVLTSHDPHFAASEALEAIERRLPLNWAGAPPIGNKGEYVMDAQKIVDMTAHEPPQPPVWATVPVYFWMDDIDFGTWSAAVEVEGVFYHRSLGRKAERAELGMVKHYMTKEDMIYRYSVLENFKPRADLERRELPVLFPLLVIDHRRHGWIRWVSAPQQDGAGHAEKQPPKGWETAI